LDSTGVVKSVAANIARVHYLPDGSGDYGLLIEPAATNVCLQSEDTATTWTNTGVAFSSSVLAPDNNYTADELKVDASTGNHWIEQAYTGSTTNNFCASVF